MASHPRRVVSEADSRVKLGEAEEAVAEIVEVQYACVVFDDVGHVQEDLDSIRACLRSEVAQPT